MIVETDKELKQRFTCDTCGAIEFSEPEFIPSYLKRFKDEYIGSLDPKSQLKRFMKGRIEVSPKETYNNYLRNEFNSVPRGSETFEDYVIKYEIEEKDQEKYNEEYDEYEEKRREKVKS